MSKGKEFPRSPCPIAGLLELVGDKWSLLLIRDMLRGKKTYGELADSPERIPTNILADRLKRLENAAIIERTPYQERPVRYAYTLTEKGRELDDVLKAVVGWGKKHLPGSKTIGEVGSDHKQGRRPRPSPARNFRTS